MELAIAYELVGPDGTRVVFGNGSAATADPDWVGYLDPDNGITGLLDGADVVENSAKVPVGHGGIQGPHWLGLRPGTIQGIVAPNGGRVLQERYLAKIKRACRALDADATLKWTPTVDGIQRLLRLRRTARPAFPGRVPQTFQLAMSSRDPYVLSAAEQSLQLTPGGSAGELGIGDPISDPITSPLNTAAQLYVTNSGDAETWPRFRINGPITNPELLNNTTGKRIRLVYTLGAGEYLDVYPQTGQVLLGGSADRYGAYDFTQSDWWTLLAGQNDVRLLAAAFGAGANAIVYWRHAWE